MTLEGAGIHFLGTGERLLCGDGTLASSGNMQLLDSNGDRRVDLSYAVSVFGFLFLGRPPPALGTRCIPIPGCPEESPRRCPNR